MIQNSVFRLAAGLAGVFVLPVCGVDSVRVKDISPAFGSSHPTNFQVLGGQVYFAAVTADQGRELWRTDGTEAGTSLVRDFTPGSAHSFGGDNDSYAFGVMGGNLYFKTSDNRLWRSDGTDAGTLQLNPDGVLYLIGTRTFTGGNSVFFVGATVATGTELWRTDGTVAGTAILADLNGGPDSSRPAHLAVAGGVLYFSNSVSPYLFRSDGTPAGTVPVKAIGSYGQPVAVGNLLYFTGSDGAHGIELMKTDGTAAGTGIVKDLTVGSGSSEILQLTRVGTGLYFVKGAELWKSDGTEAGTVRVETLNTDSFAISGLTGAGNTLFFKSGTPASGEELWKSDGTEAGTVMVKDIDSRAGRSSGVSLLTAVGNRVYFTASEATNGISLWKSDGSEAGTVRINGPSPENLFFDGARIYFSGFGATDASGWELWKYEIPADELPAPPDALQSWRLTHFASSVAVGDAADEADPDQDGVSNLVEFAIGTDPKASAGEVAAGTAPRAGRPTIMRSPGGAPQVLFSRRADLAGVGLAATPEFSSDLSTWQSAAAAPQVVGTLGDLQILSLEVPEALRGSVALFFQLRIGAAK